MPREKRSPAPLAGGNRAGIVSGELDSAEDTLPHTDLQRHAARWLARRADVPLTLAGALAALAGLGRAA